MEKTDYERVDEKLKEINAQPKGSISIESEKSFKLEFYAIGENDLIVWSNSKGHCGLYSFVGIPGDPVEKDLEFIENLYRQTIKDTQERRFRGLTAEEYEAVKKEVGFVYESEFLDKE